MSDLEKAILRLHEGCKKFGNTKEGVVCTTLSTDLITAMIQEMNDCNKNFSDKRDIETCKQVWNIAFRKIE